MNRIVVRNAAVLAMGAAALAWTSTASAQTVVQTAPPAPPQSNVVVAPAQPAPVAAEAAPASTFTPNRALLMSGLVLFGAPYIASVSIAATSGHQGDDDLYIPVVGPWLDLGQRGDCAIGAAGCGGETANKVLLIGDGILQSVGALEIVGSLVFPETTAVTTVTTSADGGFVRVMPGHVGMGGYGLAAFGAF